MGKPLCFCLEGKDLYLEKVLVEYMDIPILFLCEGAGEYYLALCTNIDELVYVLVFVKPDELSDMLYGKISIQDIFLKQEEYWEVFSEEHIQKDKVIKHRIENLDVSYLPEKGARFQILADDIRQFAKEFP